MKNEEAIIHQAWEERASLKPGTRPEAEEAVRNALRFLNHGERRIAEKTKEGWQVNEWLKKAVLLSFRLTENHLNRSHGLAFDKVPLKLETWQEDDFKKAGFRVVPGAVVRMSAYIGRDVVLMPSFVNVGAYIGDGTMIDTWATVGSCAQVGANCHISGGVGLGGVLEPLQAAPVIIEDNCFIGARSEIVEGVLVEEGAVIGMGVFIGASTPIVDRTTGEVFYGRVPPYSVVLSGSLPGKPFQSGAPGPHLNCAVIVKTVDEKTRRKTSINELLRAA